MSGEEEDASSVSKSFWVMAGALTASVKQRTTEVLTAVQTTDWKAELQSLQQGIKEEGEEAATLAKSAADQLPSAVEHLPTSASQATAVLRAHATTATKQLQAVGKGLGALGHRLVNSTSELFDQVSNAIQAELHSEGQPGGSRGASSSSQSLAAKYSRLDADVAAMQRDSSTYCDEPEDEADFGAWRAGFDLGARQADIDRLVAENTFMRELQARIVPLIVEHDAFWTRYFYRLHKLQQRHEAIAALTEQAEARGAEEELGWGSEEEGVVVPDFGMLGAHDAPPAALWPTAAADDEEEEEEEEEGEGGEEGGRGPAAAAAGARAAPRTAAAAAPPPAPGSAGGDDGEPLSLQPLAAALASSADDASDSAGHSTTSWQEVGDPKAQLSSPEREVSPEAPAEGGDRVAGAAPVRAAAAAPAGAAGAASAVAAAVAAGLAEDDGDDLDWGADEVEIEGAGAGGALVSDGDGSDWE